MGNRTNQDLIEKLAEDMNRQFTEKDMQMALRRMKGCSTSLNKQMQIRLHQQIISHPCDWQTFQDLITHSGGKALGKSSNASRKAKQPKPHGGEFVNIF